ncbi:creatininase family protein [Nitratireductor sp.]|uniref:creatininase family protein n=1 Tax=Nitratireductor sp. TaxID=1872084 RepID=UPI0025D0C946|nr:creatininase family protein [Nitratireductor sp.]
MNTQDNTHTIAEKIAVLPIGATEQHGPHLSPDTDWIIAQGIVEAVKKAVPEYLDIVFLPVEKIGYSVEHSDSPSTRSMTFEEAANRWIDIGASQYRAGLRKLVILNAHGGNSPLLTIVTTELRVRFGMLAAATSWTRFGYPKDLVSDSERALGIHGGFIETSVMLALRPDLVDMQKAADFKSAQEDFQHSFKHLRAYGPHAFGWMMRDLAQEGVTGNASAASAEAGHRIIAHSVTGFLELLEDVHRFDLGHFNH